LPVTAPATRWSPRYSSTVAPATGRPELTSRTVAVTVAPALRAKPGLADMQKVAAQPSTATARAIDFIVRYWLRRAG
jgi:hypothetical protein